MKLMRIGTSWVEALRVDNMARTLKCSDDHARKRLNQAFNVCHPGSTGVVLTYDRAVEMFVTTVSLDTEFKALEGAGK